jgi:hypothetical protein
MLITYIQNLMRLAKYEILEDGLNKAGIARPEQERHTSRKRMRIGMACAGSALFLTLGCGFLSYAAAPAPTAPATAAPATAPPLAVPATEAPVSLPTSEPNWSNTPLPTAAQPIDIHAQLEQIDAALRQQITGSIAYNKPETMNLGETTTLELLLNPTVSAEVLGTQVTEPGRVQTATIEITPQMKAELISPLVEAFTIQPIQDEVQLVSASQTTRWSWSVTARQSGTQKLVLVVSRLVKFEGQDYWREVETYTADIQIVVPFARRISSLDWKWIVSIIIALASLPFFWGWAARRRKKSGEE